MKPLDNSTPTIQGALQELVSAMSALNMPTPVEAPPDLVEHAYEHIAVAVKILSELAKAKPAPDILRLELSNWMVTPEIFDEVQTKVHAEFLGRLVTPMVRRASQKYAEDLLTDLLQRGTPGVSRNGGNEE